MLIYPSTSAQNPVGPKIGQMTKFRSKANGQKMRLIGKKIAKQDKTSLSPKSCSSRLSLLSPAIATTASTHSTSNRWIRTKNVGENMWHCWYFVFVREGQRESEIGQRKKSKSRQTRSQVWRTSHQKTVMRCHTTDSLTLHLTVHSNIAEVA